MVLLDLADLFERAFRAQSQVVEFVRDEQAPAKWGGHAALQMRYHYVLPDSPLHRQGIVRLTTVGGKLFLANYTAPAMHYFNDGLPEALAIMDSAKF